MKKYLWMSSAAVVISALRVKGNSKENCTVASSENVPILHDYETFIYLFIHIYSQGQNPRKCEIFAQRYQSQPLLQNSKNTANIFLTFGNLSVVCC